MTLRSRSRTLVAVMCMLANDRQRNKSGVVSSLNGRYMTVYVKVTLVAFRGHEHGNTRMLAHKVIEGGPHDGNQLTIGYHLAELDDVKVFGHFWFKPHFKVTR